MAVADPIGGAAVRTSIEAFDDERLRKLGRYVLELETAAPVELAISARAVVEAFLALPSETDSTRPPPG